MNHEEYNPHLVFLRSQKCRRKSVLGANADSTIVIHPERSPYTGYAPKLFLPEKFRFCGIFTQ